MHGEYNHDTNDQNDYTDVHDATPKTHDDYKHSEKHHTAIDLHFLCLTILAFFMVELITKVAVMRGEFVQHKLEIFDAFVIIISFFVEVIPLFLESMVSLVVLEFVILLRLWRIVRVLNGRYNAWFVLLTLI